jgi:hypothetical protein
VGCRVLVLIQRQIDAHALKFATSVQCSREAFQLVPTMFAPRDATLNLTLGLVGCFCLRLLTSVLLLVSVAQTQSTSRSPPNSPESDATALAKETQNPVGDVASIPFQFNFSNGGDLKDDTFLNLNFQPVVPLHVSSGLTLITRTIVPIVSFPAPGRTRLSGIGDIQEQLFFTAAHPGPIIWGIGPAFSFPTATTSPAKTGTWAAGGSFVVLTTPDPFVIGALVVQFSPLTDSNGPPRTNAFLLQPFINYNFGKGWALSTSPMFTANWDAPSDDRWTVPVGMGITRTFSLNRQPMSLGIN